MVMILSAALWVINNVGVDVAIDISPVVIIADGVDKSNDVEVIMETPVVIILAFVVKLAYTAEVLTGE